MAYTPPTIGVAGLSVPSYNDIVDYLTTTFRSLYGQQVYLGNDSADFQFISLVALLASDAFRAMQLDYTNRSPSFAIGAALDSLVKINGLTRKVATFSNCDVTLTGTPGTVINNGLVGDINGNQWALPSVVTIDIGGSVIVTATCTVPGAVSADVGQIINILTPTSGWTGVTNATAANLGSQVETDAALRARQALSTALPSITMLAGTVAGVAAVAGVTRYNVVENPTSAVDSYGNPPHSVTAVVEGGTDLAVATAIFNNRGIGCDTNGSTNVVVTDPNTGFNMTINFYRPAYKAVYVTLDVHELTGYVSQTTTDIKNAVVDYLNSLQIGEIITISGLYAAAMQATPNLSQPLFSVRALKLGTSPSPSGTSDITVNFNEVSQGILSHVVINIV